jgi:hypothetical protein
MDSTGYNEGADKLGIASALVCTVHCLLIPALFLIKYLWAGNTGEGLPGLGSVHHGGGMLPWWWESLDYLFLIVSFIAVYHAASHAASTAIKLSLWVFWSFLATSIFFEQLHWMAYIASAGLIVTHLINLRRHHLLVQVGNPAE